MKACLPFAILSPMLAVAKKPHIISILIDDTGFYDTQVHNPDSFMTPNIGTLAREGIILDRHTTYLYCSPTRRSFLSGRFPVHISGHQANVCTNYLPLQFDLLPAKLKKAGYETHMVGKGHLGYQTTDHLPINRGFDSHVGYLGGAEDYHWGNTGCKNLTCPDRCQPDLHTCKKDMWHDHGPGNDIIDAIYYSSIFYTKYAVNLIRKRDKSKQFYLHQTYQSVHAPFEEPPIWEQIPKDSAWWDHTWGSMLNSLDRGIGNITAALRTEGMYANTLIVLTSDNGGDCGPIGKPANNYPLKGRKCTPWDGGTRTATFVSGGFLPLKLRGTRSTVVVHVADWYATLSILAGVDPSNPVHYGGGVHDIDGVDIWPAITGANGTNPRATPGDEGEPAWIPPTEWSLLMQYNNGTIMKLITQAQQTNIFAANGSQTMCTDPCVSNDTDTVFNEAEFLQQLEQGVDPRELAAAVRALPPGPTPLPWGGCKVCTPEHPCLFDVTADPSESNNLAEMFPHIVAKMMAKLNSYKPYVDGSMTSAELESYDCAKNQWAQWGNFSGPCCTPKTR